MLHFLPSPALLDNTLSGVIVDNETNGTYAEDATKQHHGTPDNWSIFRPPLDRCTTRSRGVTPRVIAKFENNGCSPNYGDTKYTENGAPENISWRSLVEMGEEAGVFDRAVQDPTSREN